MSTALFLNILLFLAFGLAGMAFTRGALILLILFIASQGLGFIAPEHFTVTGLFDVHALLLLIGIIFSCVSITRWGELRHSWCFPSLLVFAALWAFAVMLPVSRAHSDLFLAIKASKEFLTIFLFIPVFLFIRTEKDIRWGWYFLLILGGYYSFQEMISQVGGESLISIWNYDFRREEPFFWKIYPPFWPIILLAFLVYVYELSLAGKKYVGRAFLSGCGLLLTFFRSYLLATVAVIPIMLFLAGQSVSRTFVKTVTVTAFVCMLVLSIAIGAGGTFEMVDHLSQKFLVSGVTEFHTNSGGALAGRKLVARERWAVLSASPTIGFGFIDKDSPFGWRIKHNIRGTLLGMIDLGFLDMALKFGVVGSVVLTLAVLGFLVAMILTVRRAVDVGLKCRALATASMICVFLIVLPVHAPLTNSFGLLPLALALGLVERERLLTRRPQSSSMERCEEARTV